MNLLEGRNSRDVVSLNMIIITGRISQIKISGQIGDSDTYIVII